MEKSRVTCLFGIHEKIGAKLTAFFGYTLPLWYTTIKEEHLSVRRDAGVFDISHMGMLGVSGPGGGRFLSHLSSNSLRKVDKGFFVYSMFLAHDGGILDDVMVGPMGPDAYLVIANASNVAKIHAWMSSHKPNDVQIKSYNDTHGLIALQGPRSGEILNGLFGQGTTALFSPFSLRELSYDNQRVWVSRTGYTGEDGYEIMVGHSLAPVIFEKILAGGACPCGLGARDTLRIEAGLPLYGQELSESLTPLVTRYSKWVVNLNHPFIGKHALESHVETRCTVGLVVDGTAIPRTGYDIIEGGQITSGTLSPSLNKPIGMAIVPVSLAVPGTRVHIRIRQTAVPATVVTLPFVHRTV